MRRRLETNGWKILTLSQQETEALVKAQADKWMQFVRKAGIKGE